MKKLISTILVFVLFTSFSVTAYADVTSTEPIPTDETNSEIMPLAEEREWFYRNNNGMVEKRLWSYTYGKWLTDWIVVGPAP